MAMYRQSVCMDSSYEYAVKRLCIKDQSIISFNVAILLVRLRFCILHLWCHASAAKCVPLSCGIYHTQNIIWCGITHARWRGFVTSASFLAEISVSSPRKICILIIYKKYFLDQSIPKIFILILKKEAMFVTCTIRLNYCSVIHLRCMPVLC